MLKLIGGIIFLGLSLNSINSNDEIYGIIGLMFSFALIFAALDDIFFKKK